MRRSSRFKKEGCGRLLDKEAKQRIAGNCLVCLVSLESLNEAEETGLERHFWGFWGSWGGSQWSLGEGLWPVRQRECINPRKFK